MKILLESERHIGKNPFDFLYRNIIPNGSFVSIGYFNDHVISFGPRSRKNITTDNDAALQRHIASLPDGSFKRELEKFRTSKKYQDALANGGTAPLDLEGDCHIVKIGRYIVNWKNPKAFSAFYAKQGDARAALRTKYGFGGPDDTYPEGDWRQRYAGTTRREQIDPANINRGNVYRDNIGDSGFYGNLNDPNSVSIRQFSNPKLNKTPEWFFVDASGNMEYLSSELMNHLAYNYSKAKVKEAIEYLTQEEEQFVKELDALKSTELEERTMLLNNIIYLTGTTVNEKGEKEPFTWLNDEIIMEKYPFMKKEDLDGIIKKCVKISKKETTEMNESFVFIPVKKNFLVEKQDNFVYVKTYSYGKCKAFQQFDMASYQTVYDVYDEQNNYLGMVHPMEPTIDALAAEIDNDNFIDEDEPVDENHKVSVNKAINEGTTNDLVIDRWENIKAHVGAETLVNEIFQYLPEDQIVEMTDWFYKVFDIDDESQLNENWFHDVLSLGTPLNQVITNFVKDCLKKIAEKHENYNIKPYNVRYDASKEIIYYKDHEETDWVPIHDLKNGVIANNIKEKTHCGNDTEKAKAVEAFLKMNKFGRDLASQMKEDEASAKSSEDFKNKPEIKYRDFSQDHGGYEKMKKGLGSAKYYYSFPANRTHYYFANRQTAEEAAKAFGMNSTDVRAHEV